MTRRRLLNLDQRGVAFALASALFLGASPVFGKQAILLGMVPLAVVAFRTAGAFLLLLLVVAIFRPRHLYIYPVGLAGATIAGALNGVGSLFYYAALERIGAGLGQFLFALYPLFVAGLLYLDGQQPSRLTLLRLAMSVPGILLLTRAGPTQVDGLGVLFMLIASLLYALHIPINQRVLFEAPAPTVTLYTLLAMTGVTVPAYLLFPRPLEGLLTPALTPLIALTCLTFFSRLALFAGVKMIGGAQTSIIGLGELLVTVALAYYLLGETLSLGQWAGALVLTATLLLAFAEPAPRHRPRLRGWLYWLRTPTPGSAPSSDPEEELGMAAGSPSHQDPP